MCDVWGRITGLPHGSTTAKGRIRCEHDQGNCWPGANYVPGEGDATFWIPVAVLLKEDTGEVVNWEANECRSGFRSTGSISLLELLDRRWHIPRNDVIQEQCVAKTMYSKQHALSDKFEVKGYWWLPGDTSCRMPGVLTYEDGRISLELFGFLHVQTMEKPRQVDANVRREPIVLGSGEGQEYTLYQVQPIGPRIHAPVNNVEWTYSAHYLFVGAHFESEAALCFPAAWFSFSELENWLGQSAFDSSAGSRRARTLPR